jgi:hypothetical protein
MNNIDNVDDITDLVPVAAVPAVVTEKVSLPVPSPTDTEEEEDFALARDTMRSLLHRSEGLLEGISRVADEAEHPRAFEVASTMINTIAGVAKELVGLQKTKKEIKGDLGTVGTVNNTQNNIEQAVFVGSTKDLLAKVKGNAPQTIDATVIHSAPVPHFYPEEEDEAEGA